jgi:hypothetical protein
VDRVHGAVDRWHAQLNGEPWVAWTLGAVAPCRRMGVRARRGSLAAAKGDEGNEVVPEGCSPDHERW